MANQLITLGLGTPSDIPHFILFGLSVNDTVINAVADVTVVVQAKSRTIVVPTEHLIVRSASARTVVVR